MALFTQNKRKISMWGQSSGGLDQQKLKHKLLFLKIDVFSIWTNTIALMKTQQQSFIAIIRDNNLFLQKE